MTNKQSDLARVAALLVNLPRETFLVVSYKVDGATLSEVGTVEFATAEAAIARGKLAIEHHEVVIVMRQTEDEFGFVQSAVLQKFDHT